MRFAQLLALGLRDGLFRSLSLTRIQGPVKKRDECTAVNLDGLQRVMIYHWQDGEPDTVITALRVDSAGVRRGDSTVTLTMYQ